MQIEARIPQSETDQWTNSILVYIRSAADGQAGLTALFESAQKDLNKAMNAAFQAGIEFGRNNPSR